MATLTLKLMFFIPQNFVSFYFLFYLTCVFIFSKTRVSRAIFPPIELPSADFKENPKALTEANKFKAKTHDGKVVTREDLEHIEALMLQDVNDISIKNKNE